MNGNIKSELKRLLELHDSRSRAIPRREIRRILNYHNDRQLRLLIHELRVEGLPVFFSTSPSNGKNGEPAGPAGYWLPSSRQEYEFGINKWKSYLGELGEDLRVTEHAGALWLKPAVQRKLF